MPERQATKNINTFEYVYPKRGRIISKDGFVLAEDRKIFSIAVNLNVKPNEQAIEKLISNENFKIVK